MQNTPKRTPYLSPALLGLAVLLQGMGGGTLWAQNAAQTGKIFAGGRSEEGVEWFNRTLEDKLEALAFERLAPDAAPWEGGPQLEIPSHLEEDLGILHFDDAIEHYFNPEPEVKRQPGIDFQRSLLGVTGIMTLPNSYVLSDGEWAGGISYISEEVGPSSWPEVYQSQDNDHLKLYLNRGFKDRFEAGLMLHQVDSNIVYQPNTGAVFPVRYNDRLSLGGVNFKAAIPYYSVWVAAGFSLEFFDDDDRNYLDFREFDNISTAFLSVSDAGPRWEATMAWKYIKYASNGRAPPAGSLASQNQSGFSPTSQWNQIGLGLEYGKWGGLSLMFEGTQRNRIDFTGISEKEMNYGVKYETDDIVFKLFSLRENQRDQDRIGGSLTARF